MVTLPLKHRNTAELLPSRRSPGHWGDIPATDRAPPSEENPSLQTRTKKDFLLRQRVRDSSIGVLIDNFWDF